MNDVPGGSRLVPFADRHVDEAVRIYCHVFRAEPWCEPWTEEEALGRIRWVRAGLGARGWAVTDPALVGFALGFEELGADGEPAFLVFEMAVRADRQCTGIGTRLLRAIEADLARAGIAVVEVLTVAGKWPCHFYERNGYAVRAELGDGQVVLARGLAVR